ncbi:MAG: hypothetical protein ACP5IZ_10675 [Thermoprotei archaeon]|jgi:hypothetical protein
MSEFLDLISQIAGIFVYLGYALMVLGIGYNTILYITAETPEEAARAKRNIIKVFIGGALLTSAAQIINFLLNT